MVSVTVTTVAPLVMLQNAPGFVALRFAPVRCAFGGSGVGGLMTLNLRQFPTWNFTMSHQQFFRGSKMRILFVDIELLFIFLKEFLHFDSHVEEYRVSVCTEFL